MQQEKRSSARARAGRIEVSACGRPWTLHRPADLESLWESMTEDAFTEDERLPYWVELWPASLALAGWLHANRGRIAGKVCLDLGCGLGFTALVASWLGARVIGMDYERDALVYARKNAGTNRVPAPLWAVMDWRAPALRPGSCDFIWGGDIMYEHRFVDPVFAFINHSLAEGGVAWVAEPARNVYTAFQDVLARSNWRSRCVLREQVEPLHVQTSMISVNLWELTRA